MSAKRDSALYSAAFVLPRLPGFLLLPAYAAVLSLGDMGRLATCWIFIDLFQTLAGLGMKQALGRYFPLAEGERRRRETLSAAVLGSIAGGALAAGLATAVFALPAFRGRIHFLAEIDSRLFAYLLLASMLGNLSSTLVLYFRAQRKAGAYFVAGCLGMLLELGAAGTLLLLGKISLGNLLAVECLKQGATLAFVAWHGRADLRPAWARETWTPMVRYGLWLVPVGLCEWIALSSDRFWLGQLAGMGSVGVYGFFGKFAAPLAVLYTGGIMEFHSQVYFMRGEEGLEFTRGRLEAYLVRAGALSLAAAALFPVGVHLAARYWPAFPTAYLPGVKVFPLLIAAGFVVFWGKYYGTVLEYQYRTRAVLVSLGLGAAAGALLAPLLIRASLILGLDVLAGAAVSLLLACLSATVAMGGMARLGGGGIQAAKGGAVVAGCLVCYLALWAFG